MRAVQINRLTRQDANGFFVVRGQCVVRQVRIVEVKGSDAIEKAKFVPVLVDREWHDLCGAFDYRGAEPELIYHWHFEPRHDGTGVLSEALLAWDERIAVVLVFDLTLLHVR